MSEFSPVSRPRRVMILGVDGGTLDLIRPWADAGLLPTFARLMQEGCWGTLRTTVPPVTPTAWSSFLTGTNPGKHGLYDFVGRRKGSYDTWLSNASYRSGASIWGLLSEAGRRVTVFNVPLTYPIEPVNGLFVSGLLTPADATDATWPRELLDDIRQQVPAFDFSPPGMFSPGEELGFAQSITALNQTTLQVARWLMERQPWDFFMAVFMGVDIAGHFLWKQMVEGQPADSRDQTQPQARLANVIQDCYRQVDAALAELIEAAGPDVHLIVMSDHGFGSLERYIHINAWLRERGYLKLRRAPFTLLKRAMYGLGITPVSVYEALRGLGLGERMRRTGRRQSKLAPRLVKGGFLSFADVDWSRTQLYSIGFAGPIYLNLKGREPEGIVSPGAEAEALLDQVERELRALRDPETGQPLIGEIYRRGQLYTGPRADEGPDLIFLPRDMKNGSFGLFEFGSSRWFTRASDRTGTHRMNGILFMRGPGIRPGIQLDESCITDIAPTVLALMGLPIPNSMDGHVLDKAMTEELRSSLDIVFAGQEGESAATASAMDLDDRDEAALREHLRGLGYVA
jgi:predicted AlkP superfamily phosphohydrolase/phosphomutase